MQKIGIIGSGAVAKALGNGFIKHGYQVMLSSRDISTWLPGRKLQEMMLLPAALKMQRSLERS